MVMLYKDPNGEKIFVSISVNSCGSGKGDSSDGIELNMLKKRVNELEHELAQIKVTT